MRVGLNNILNDFVEKEEGVVIVGRPEDVLLDLGDGLGGVIPDGEGYVLQALPEIHCGNPCNDEKPIESTLIDKKRRYPRSQG